MLDCKDGTVRRVSREGQSATIPSPALSPAFRRKTAPGLEQVFLCLRVLLEQALAGPRMTRTTPASARSDRVRRSASRRSFTQRPPPRHTPQLEAGALPPARRGSFVEDPYSKF